MFKLLKLGKASTIAYPYPNFHSNQKVRTLTSFSISLNLSRPFLKMQQGVRTLKQISCAAMIALCLCHVWWSWVHAPLRTLVVQLVPHPMKLHCENVLNRH